jgi:hypothetical protein
VADPTEGGLAALLRRHAGLITSSGFGLVWLVLASTWTDRHFHLMPFAVAASWSYARRAEGGEPLTAKGGLASAAGGLAIALVTIFELDLTGRLNGATLWGGSELAAESVAVALVGAAWGWRVATRDSRGLLFGGPTGETVNRGVRGDEVDAS